MAELHTVWTGTAKSLGAHAGWQAAVAAGKTVLPYFAWVQTRTPAFKAWFGDWERDTINTGSQATPHSQIVSAQTREPLVAYHGTQRVFDAFKKQGIAVNFKSPQRHIGFFMTDCPSYADRYTSEFANRVDFREGAQCLPVYLALKNPKVFPLSQIDTIEDVMTATDAKAFRQDLEAQGYDGIIFEGEARIGPVREFVAFRPEQIKSVFNSGAFDPYSPSLTDAQPTPRCEAEAFVRTLHGQHPHVVLELEELASQDYPPTDTVWSNFLDEHDASRRPASLLAAVTKLGEPS